MTATAEFPRNPVAYMTTVEKSLGRSMTVMEAGEIYGAWQRAVPMEEIAATIRTRDNAADAGAADGETAGSVSGRNAPAPQPSSTVMPPHEHKCSKVEADGYHTNCLRDGCPCVCGAVGEWKGGVWVWTLPHPSPECPACHDPVRREGLCASCDVFDSDDDEVAPMTGRINFGDEPLPDRFGGGE